MTCMSSALLKKQVVQLAFCLPLMKKKSNMCNFLEAMSVQPLSPTFSSDHQPAVELGRDSVADEFALEKIIAAPKPKGQNYVSQSAVALRCRVMPPPCFRNPYLKDVSEKEIDPFGNQRLKCAGIILVSSFTTPFQ